MASLIAAVAHDLDHPGVNQPFLIATSNHLATLYEVRTYDDDHNNRFDNTIRTYARNNGVVAASTTLFSKRRRFSAEHFGAGESPLAVGGRLSAREPRRGETQPHHT